MNILHEQNASKFWAKVSVQVHSSCWYWIGNRTADGYGVFSMNGTTIAAHRLMYQLANGPIPDDLIVRHKCDTPKCVNPLHLETGTQLDNVNDMIVRKRNRTKLSAGAVRAMRERLAAGETTVSLALDFNISREMVSRIKNRKAWNHID